MFCHKEIIMKTIVTLLLLIFVWVSCRQNSVANSSYKSCKEFCSFSEGYPLASTVVDIRCHRIKITASIEGKKKKYCYDGPLLKGIDKEAVDPDPVQCKALHDQAQKKCDALTPDPSMIRPVSGSVIYKGGRPVMINGEVCDCTKKHSPQKAAPGTPLPPGKT